MDTVIFDSPVGALHVSADGRCIVQLKFGDGPVSTDVTPLLARAVAQLEAYFDGGATGFNLPLIAPQSPFQAKVRAAMLAIPFGETRSYGDIAHTIGGAPRAVGQACGRNPIPIFVPCHRVLAAGGSIGGFSGGDGQPTKRKLLAHEAGPVFPTAIHGG